jgi:formyltetrahydrofolate deformylase
MYLLELGELPIEIPLVVSNREDLKQLVESHGIPFMYLPIDSNNKIAQEKTLIAKMNELKIDFVVLARYMQILSADFCNAMPGKIINIHHSFLPGFKGAKPYHQAHERGVKIIGATAHFVTADLDEGPIIEQDVAHVTHSSTPDELIALGRDIERRVLAKAVKLMPKIASLLLGNEQLFSVNYFCKDHSRVIVNLNSVESAFRLIDHLPSDARLKIRVPSPLLF